MSDVEGTYKDEDTLRELYFEQDLTTTEIGEIFDVTHQTINYWCHKHGFDMREAKPRFTGKCHFYIDATGHVMVRGREDEETFAIHRLMAIAEYGIDAVVGNDVHHKNGIPWDNRIENIEILTVSEHRSHHNLQKSQGNGEWKDKELLRELYCDENMSCYAIGKMLNCSGPNIQYWVEKYDLD